MKKIQSSTQSMAGSSGSWRVQAFLAPLHPYSLGAPDSRDRFPCESGKIPRYNTCGRGPAMERYNTSLMTSVSRQLNHKYEATAVSSLLSSLSCIANCKGIELERYHALSQIRANKIINANNELRVYPRQSHHLSRLLLIYNRKSIFAQGVT